MAAGRLAPHLHGLRSLGRHSSHRWRSDGETTITPKYCVLHISRLHFYVYAVFIRELKDTLLPMCETIMSHQHRSHILQPVHWVWLQEDRGDSLKLMNWLIWLNISYECVCVQKTMKSCSFLLDYIRALTQLKWNNWIKWLIVDSHLQ